MCIVIYDVIVVGAGHAGCEASAAAANMGMNTLLITMNMQTIGQMSCNPAMGGIAKGQIVREIDALGGYSGVVSDKSAIQFRMLNRSKGPAMWSPRTQNDRFLFSYYWRLMLEQTPNLYFWQDSVESLIIEKNKILGVRTLLGKEFFSKTVILTNGTFLNGLIHVGEKHNPGGRMGEKESKGITEQLQKLGFRTGRMKTGTPPRVDGRSLNYDAMEIQPGEESNEGFSYKPQLGTIFFHPELNPNPKKQLPCHITYTNPKVHKILEKGFDRSPMFTGKISGVGPRYCPSIEDKICRFSERERHQIFVEPEGWDTIEVYVNGFSTSLPMEIQEEAIRHIPGFENAKLFRPGYAIEYDYFPPDQLYHTLETKIIENLFFAGQINGTTGYEEAAGQGIIAGINAALKVKKKPPFVLKRHEAYIGVLIDDLITKSTNEPYRMFTSRSEYRLLLRQDNADLRLKKHGYELGLVKENEYIDFMNKLNQIERAKEVINRTSIDPDLINNILKQLNSSEIIQKTKLIQIISRPEISISTLIEKSDNIRCLFLGLDKNAITQAEIQIKYAAYLERERLMAEKMEKWEGLEIPKNIDYSKIKSLSAEGQQKLIQHRPHTLGQASKISGVSPSDIAVLMVYLGK
ncbi:MAG: tRNA uridine-5-carboxymethylaminomethyl(34) synthesis enzyme MnmG [Bacteroidia bacterium]|nr:tRNA uridine-5-carboxymethylaminomethyl(34) synthesis enzyme MnmG [Bacteroidia bacterium]